MAADVFVLRVAGKCSYSLVVGRAIIESTTNNKSQLTLQRSSILADSVERPK